MANSLNIVLAPQFEIKVQQVEGGTNPAGFTVIAGISRSTGAGAGNQYTNQEKTKLGLIEDLATADQTGAEIKTLYELEADTNAFDDAAVTKLGNVETAATTDQTDAEIRTAVEAATDSNVFNDADHTKLNNIETAATIDQTGGEIKSAYEGETDTNAYTDSEKAKLAAIDATHYGAPLADIAALVALPESGITDKERRYVASETSDYFYDATAVSGAYAPTDQTGGTGFWLQVIVSGDSPASIKVKYESNADTNVFLDAEKSKLATIEASAKDDQTGAEIKTAYELEADTNAYTDAAVSKLAGIDTGAKDDQTGAEIKSAYEGETNAYTDTKNTKLAGIETSATADQTDAEIRTAVEAATDSNVFTDADHTKLNAIEALAEVNHVVAVSEHVVDYTLAIGDADDIQEMNKATAIVLTIPTNATVAFPVGTIISVSMTGVGVATITAAATVTLNGVSAGSGAMTGQWGGCSLYKRATNTWVVQGAIGVVA